MHILVINAGSSSLKAAVIEAATGERVAELSTDRLPDRGDHRATLHPFMLELREKVSGIALHGIGHRVVHGGAEFTGATRLTDAVEAKIEALNDLAPLHNPVNLAGIRLARELWPEVPHFAAFDTAFHHSLPRRSQTYALPRDLMREHGIRRYGFHGLSHQYVAGRAATFMRGDYRSLRLISCHLGNGCSVTAIEFGRSIETSMGMTPLEGLVMGTRSGDIDPGIPAYLHRKTGMDTAEIDALLNRQSGLAGLSGAGNDMRHILERSTEGDPDSQLALQVFTHRLRKYIGAYAAVMGGVDAIIFTGGIGENSSIVRHRAAQRLDYLGAVIDEDLNHSARLTATEDVIEFSRSHSRVKLLAIRTDEQLAIARDCAKLLRKEDEVNTLPTIPIAISARHCHLTRETLDKLYGPGYALTVKKQLSQPGQFAAEETVTVVGPRNRLERVRILGPLRSVDQIEISRTDEFFLGLDAPVRESGKVDNTPGCQLIGPAGSVDLEDGVICAWRHIHMTPTDAERFGVRDRDTVDVAVDGPERGLTFGNVLIRVSPDYKLEMHIDTNEGNAAKIDSGDSGVLRGTHHAGTLRRRATMVT
ncbi:acetate/propionate family kinase [Lewinella sp. JB7]|uniref:acetate/propionate family kinase n=1 Tax=Lewinella sp. JB7 TaxID=2962887 RepID=UPI0020CA1DAE|nr:acetate/propionate family kinase [Lewinella sp. JB7]MCP9234887.1 acetate/propionate family kinase [Lewinella sp. JB7]